MLRVFCGEDGGGGNSLGVFFDGAEVRPQDRQPIAADLGFSETVFVDDVERRDSHLYSGGGAAVRGTSGRVEVEEVRRHS